MQTWYSQQQQLLYELTLLSCTQVSKVLLQFMVQCTVYGAEHFQPIALVRFDHVLVLLSKNHVKQFMVQHYFRHFFDAGACCHRLTRTTIQLWYKCCVGNTPLRAILHHKLFRPNFQVDSNERFSKLAIVLLSP